MVLPMPGLDEKCYDVFNALDQGFCTIQLQFHADGVAAVAVMVR